MCGLCSVVYSQCSCACKVVLLIGWYLVANVKHCLVTNWLYAHSQNEFHMMVADKHKENAKKIYEQYIKPDVSVNSRCNDIKTCGYLIYFN